MSQTLKCPRVARESETVIQILLSLERLQGDLRAPSSTYGAPRELERDLYEAMQHQDVQDWLRTGRRTIWARNEEKIRDPETPGRDHPAPIRKPRPLIA